MTTADIAFGRFVTWRGLRCLIVDINWRVRRTSVQIRVPGGALRWVSPDELEPLLDRIDGLTGLGRGIGNPVNPVILSENE